MHVLACAMVVVASDASARDPLTLSEAQQLAIERSPQMAAYDSTIAAARSMAIAAPHLPDPTLQFGVDYLPAATKLTSPEEREALAERYAREADRAAAQKLAAGVEIARASALAWLECHYVERMTDVANEQIKSARVELEGAERMYWAGRLSQAEFYGARSTLVMFEDKASELAHRGRAARITLKRWIGDRGDEPLGALPNIDRIRLTPGGLEGDLVRHPDVALLETNVGLAAADVRVAKASRRSEREIAATVATLDKARAAREEKLRSEVAETRVMIDEWQHARDRRDRYARELVSLAHERTMATLVAYRGGKTTLTEVLAARRAESEAQMQSVEAEREAARLWAQISFALPDSAAAASRRIPGGESSQ